MREAARFFAQILLMFLFAGVIYGQSDKLFFLDNFRSNAKNQRIDSVLRMSETYAEINPDTTLFLSNLIINDAISDKNYKAISKAYKNMADAYYYKNDYANSLLFYKKSAEADLLVVSDTSGFYIDRISDIAYCYIQLGLHEKAIELDKSALKLNQRFNRAMETADNLNNLGNSYFYLGQYNKAIEYMTKTLELDRRSGDSVAISVSLNNIGMVYSRWRKHYEALIFYEDALSYTTIQGSKAIRYSNIGMEWYYLGDYKKALNYLSKALEIDTESHQTIKIGVRKNEIAIVLSAMGEFDKALRLNQEALIIFKNADIRESQIITLSHLGDIYRKKVQPSVAERYYLESLGMAIDSKSQHHMAQNYKNLYELAEEKGEFKKALDYFKFYSISKDSIFDGESYKQLANFHVLYETEKKEQENMLLIRDNELKQRNYRLAVVVIAGLFVVLILIFFLYKVKARSLTQNKLLLEQEKKLSIMEIERKASENRLLEDRIFAEQQINRLEREKYQTEIKLKNADLASSTLCLINRNEILSEIKDKLKQNHNTQIISEVVHLINSNTDIDQDWYKFRTTFEDIYPGFFDRLNQNYPQLTDHDIRLSAYLLINLSSREIAGLMNVSIDATNKARQRLRKKLNLEPEADLTLFLTSVK